MEYTKEALGQVIRRLRNEHHLTQEELGKLVQYGRGASVTISRIENGASQPSPERLELFAEAFGISVQDLERLAHESSSDQGDSSREAEPEPEKAEEPVRVRIKRVQKIAKARTNKVEHLASQFNEAHDLARDNFFLPFVELATRIAPSDAAEFGLLSDEDEQPPTSDTEQQATYQVQLASTGVAKAITAGALTGAALGPVAAYGTFAAAATLGTASTGAAISGLSGAAATNATLALLGGGPLAAGGAGVAGGTALLAGIAAAPVALLAVGGLIWATRRSKKQEADLKKTLDRVEADLRATRPGFESLIEALTGATSLLWYIQLHGGHAYERWARLIDPNTDFTSLTPRQQEQYRDFLKIAGCQLSVASIDFNSFLLPDTEQATQHATAALQILTEARETVEALI